MHRIWLSLDTGIDDTFALLLLLKEKDIKIEGISATYGNVELEKTFKNTRDILSLAKREDIKVYKGSLKPLNNEAVYGYDCHGKNGVGNIKLKESNAKVEEESSFDMLYKKAKELKGELELIMIGPSTDFALTYFKYPDFPKYLKRVLIMGGSLSSGNRTSQAEFNIYADPLASKVLFDSGVDLVISPLDVTMKSYFDLNDIENIMQINNDVSNLFIDMNKHIMKFYYEKTGKHYFYFHDACPIIYLQKPSIFKTINCHVNIETKSKLAYGKTISDYDCDVPFTGKEKTVLIDVDREKFVSHCLSVFKQY